EEGRCPLIFVFFVSLVRLEHNSRGRKSHSKPKLKSEVFELSAALRRTFGAQPGFPGVTRPTGAVDGCGSKTRNLHRAVDQHGPLTLGPFSFPRSFAILSSALFCSTRCLHANLTSLSTLAR